MSIWESNRDLKKAQKLLELICTESEIHGDSKWGGMVQRLDLPPTWPRLHAWREICTLARELLDVAPLPKDGTHQTGEIKSIVRGVVKEEGARRGTPV